MGNNEYLRKWRLERRRKSMRSIVACRAWAGKPSTLRRFRTCACASWLGMCVPIVRALLDELCDDKAACEGIQYRLPFLHNLFKGRSLFLGYQVT